MEPIKFKLANLQDGMTEEEFLAHLRDTEGVLDLSYDPATKEVTLFPTKPHECEGLYCRLEELGYTNLRDW